MKNFTKGIIILLISIIVTGCGTFTKEIHVKMVKPIRIDKSLTKIAVITPNKGLELNKVIADKIVKKIKSSGKIIVSSREEADYIVTVAIPTKNGYKDINGKKIGLSAFAGALTAGAITYGATRSGSAGLGAAAGGLIIGGLVGYAVQDATVSLKLDVVVTNAKTQELQNTRIFSTVKQVRLKEDEGKIVLINELSTAVANLF